MPLGYGHRTQLPDKFQEGLKVSRAASCSIPSFLSPGSSFFLSSPPPLLSSFFVTWNRQCAMEMPSLHFSLRIVTNLSVAILLFFNSLSDSSPSPLLFVSLSAKMVSVPTRVILSLSLSLSFSLFLSLSLSLSDFQSDPLHLRSMELGGGAECHIHTSRQTDSDELERSFPESQIIQFLFGANPLIHALQRIRHAVFQHRPALLIKIAPPIIELKTILAKYLKRRSKQREKKMKGYGRRKEEGEKRSMSDIKRRNDGVLHC